MQKADQRVQNGKRNKIDNKLYAKWRAYENSFDSQIDKTDIII